MIEAYGMDMALCEELQKTKINRQSIRNGDAEFCVGLITHMGFGFRTLYNSTPKQLSGTLLLMDYEASLDLNELMNILWKTGAYWEKSTGGWCMKKLEEMFHKRCKIWWDIGIDEYWGDRVLIGKWIRASRYMVVGQSFAAEMFDYEETRDDYLIGP